MSTYYCFYLVRKNDDGLFEPVGNYYKNKSGEYNFSPIYCRSRSFISANEFEIEMCRMPVDEMNDELKKYFSSTGWSEDGEPYSTAHYTSLNNFIDLIGERGLVKGYVTFDDLDFLARNKFDQEVLTWGEYSLYSPEYVAELPIEKRKDYAHIAFLDTMSTEYIANAVVEAVSEMTMPQDKYYIVMNVE